MPSPLVLRLDDPRWRAFVESRPEATVFHHPAWTELLSDCYGYPSFAFGLARDDELHAGIPVIQVRIPTRRPRWIALPFTDALAPLGSVGDVSDLVRALDDHRSEQRIRSIEIRGSLDVGNASLRGHMHVLRLAADPDELLRTFSKSQVRRNIARSEREGVVVRQGERKSDLVDTFYDLHLRTRRRLGVPIQPRRFFDLLWERLISSGLGWLLIAEHVGRPVAAAVFLEWNGTTVYKFGASEHASWSVRPNHAIFWEAIRRSCVSGSMVFDFGRTELANEGLRAFKAGWGTVEHPLVYTTLGAAPSEEGAGRLGAILALTIQRSPHWVCRAMGETLYRYAA